MFDMGSHPYSFCHAYQPWAGSGWVGLINDWPLLTLGQHDNLKISEIKTSNKDFLQSCLGSDKRVTAVTDGNEPKKNLTYPTPEVTNRK